VRNSIVFYLNNDRIEISDSKAKMMLAEFLRYELCLTGTKVVCAEGDCGACTILRAHPFMGNEFLAINSCITPLATLDGSILVTVDALQEDQLHEVQRAMVECHGSQCGFCTPGFIMAMAGLVEKKKACGETEITEKEAKNATTGNLCRCTGYGPIIDATMDIDISKDKSLDERFAKADVIKDLSSLLTDEIVLETPEFHFYAPAELDDAAKYLEQHPEAKIIASSTDLGVVHNKRKLKFQRLLSLHLISELYEVSEKNNHWQVGARVSLTDLRHAFKNKLPELSSYIDIFASPQIKNIATVIGNIANASPIGDTPPVFLALEANIHLYGVKSKRKIPLDKFFLDYRKTDLQKSEFITGISFDALLNEKDFFLFKNSNRKDLDISAVNFAIKFDWQDKEKHILNRATIAAGGVAATPLRLKKLEDYLIGQKIDSGTMDKACSILQTEFTPLSDVRASSSYRRILIENFFKRAVSKSMEASL